MTVTSGYFDGQSSWCYRVRLDVRAAIAHITGDITRTYALQQLRRSERLMRQSWSGTAGAGSHCLLLLATSYLYGLPMPAHLVAQATRNLPGWSTITVRFLCWRVP